MKKEDPRMRQFLTRRRWIRRLLASRSGNVFIENGIWIIIVVFAS